MCRKAQSARESSRRSDERISLFRSAKANTRAKEDDERSARGSSRAVMTLQSVSKPRVPRRPPLGTARVLPVLDRPVLVNLVKLTLNHAVSTTRAWTTASPSRLP
jgi:hypothetical protein